MSIKTWLFGEIKQVELKINPFIGPDVDRLRKDIDAAHQRAKTLVIKLETEIRRLGQEYENAVFAAKGWALLVDHHATKQVEDDLGKLDLSEPESLVVDPQIVALKEAVTKDFGADAVLEAGQAEAARLAREALHKLPKMKQDKQRQRQQIGPE